MKLAKLQQETLNNSHTIWLEILDYCNGVGTARDFEKLALHCLQRMAIQDPRAVLSKSADLTHDTTMKELAERYRAQLRSVLRWIARPTDFSALDEEELEQRMRSDFDAARFLLKHSDGIKTELTMVVTLDMSTADAQSFFRRTVATCDSVVSALCRFIVDQIDRHEVDKEPLEKIFPFHVCERTGCDRFLFVQRRGRARFCSDICRSSANTAKKSKEEKAQRMRQYREKLKERDIRNLKNARQC